MVSNIIKERQDNKKEKSVIQRRGMLNYAKYGEKNPFTHLLSEKELGGIQPKQLSDRIHDLTKYKHEVFYYGPAEPSAVIPIIEKQHALPKTMLDYPVGEKYPELETKGNQVFFCGLRHGSD